MCSCRVGVVVVAWEVECWCVHLRRVILGGVSVLGDCCRVSVGGTECTDAVESRGQMELIEAVEVVGEVKKVVVEEVVGEGGI